MRVRKPKEPAYDGEQFLPAIRQSICIGEKVAGFVDRKTGAFKEVVLLRSQRDLDAFCAQYGVKEPIKTIY